MVGNVSNQRRRIPFTSSSRPRRGTTTPTSNRRSIMGKLYRGGSKTMWLTVDKHVCIVEDLQSTKMQFLWFS